MFYPPEDRARIISSLRFVDDVVFYEYIDELVKNVLFDTLCHGPDNYNERCRNAYEWCKKHNKEVVEIPRTEGISSSDLRIFLKQNKI